MAKKANQKPASGAKPAAENTVGPILPKTAPAPAGASPSPPVKPETPKEKGLLEKADELLEKGEIKILNDAKNSVAGGIDSLVNLAGGGAAAQVVGAIGKGAVDVFFPTNVIDIIPGGKILSGGKKAGKLAEKLGKEAAEKAAKEAAEKAAKEAAEKKAKEATKDGAKKADVSGNKGGHGKGTKRRPKDKCELMPYEDMICDGEKHHVVPHWTTRTGNAKTKLDPTKQLPGTPVYDKAPAICLSIEEHKGIHKSVDAKIESASKAGTVSAGKVKEISAEEAAKKSGCNPKNIRKQLNSKFKSPDDALFRGVKDARQVTEDIVNKVMKPRGK